MDQCRAQPCLIPRECFSAYFHHFCVIQANQSAQTGKHSKLQGPAQLEHPFFSLFIHPHYLLQRRKMVFSWRCKIPLAQLRAADQTSGRIRQENSVLLFLFVHSKMHTWLAVPRPWRRNAWFEKYHQTARGHFCSLKRCSFNCFLAPFMLSGIIWFLFVTLFNNKKVLFPLSLSFLSALML